MTKQASVFRKRLALRTEIEDDVKFLQELYGSTREEEMSLLTHWTTKQKNEFISQQFQAQYQHYRGHFGHASFEIILWDGIKIGRLYLDRRPDEIRIIDIALLPAHRRQGVGTYLLESILKEAFDKRLNVRIHVEKINPALSLYTRLGFVPIEDKGVYLLMEVKCQG